VSSKEEHTSQTQGNKVLIKTAVYRKDKMNNLGHTYHGKN